MNLLKPYSQQKMVLYSQNKEDIILYKIGVFFYRGMGGSSVAFVGLIPGLGI
jgi:hypothetical protein